jgi:hypothetical protein
MTRFLRLERSSALPVPTHAPIIFRAAVRSARSPSFGTSRTLQYPHCESAKARAQRSDLAHENVLNRRGYDRDNRRGGPRNPANEGFRPIGADICREVCNRTTGPALVKTRKLVAILAAERRHGRSLSTHRDVRRRELECPLHVETSQTDWVLTLAPDAFDGIFRAEMETDKRAIVCVIPHRVVYVSHS